jgi:hypothetical protein
MDVPDVGSVIVKYTLAWAAGTSDSIATVEMRKALSVDQVSNRIVCWVGFGRDRSRSESETEGQEDIKYSLGAEPSGD